MAWADCQRARSTSRHIGRVLIAIMEPGAWLVLAAMNWGQPVTLAWPAPNLIACGARTLIAQPTHDKTYCTFEKPKADAYGPPLPLPSS
jgi:hypothetical protein